jgi:hypothetical protein
MVASEAKLVVRNSRNLSVDEMKMIASHAFGRVMFEDL